MSNGKRINVNKDKVIAAVALFVFLVSLIPILFLGFFDYATGDDLGYGAPCRSVLRSGGNAIDMVKAAFFDVIREYYSWGGNWASGFLHRFEPSVFGERFYCITVILSITALTLPTFFLMRKLLVKKAGMKRSVFIAIYSLMSLILIQYMPSPRGGIFWFTGATAYTLAFGAAISTLLFSVDYLESGNILWLAAASATAIYAGGSGYPEFVLAGSTMFFFSLSAFYRAMFRPGSHSTIRKSLALLFPVGLLCLSFIISAKAPGNALRSGSAGLAPGAGRIINTFLGALYRGLTDPVAYIAHAPLIGLYFLLIIILTYETFDENKENNVVSFFRPYIVVPVLFLVYCLTYTPEIYAGQGVASGFSGGVYDTYFFTFMLTSTLSLVYITCFVKKYVLRKETVSRFIGGREFRLAAFFLFFFICIVFSGRLFDDTVDYTCIKFAMSGQLRDYNEQMKERIRILEDRSITNAVVPEMNDYQGPFMHMPLVSDPNAFPNLVTAEFYGKESVIAVPREEFYMSEISAVSEPAETR